MSIVDRSKKSTFPYSTAAALSYGNLALLSLTFPLASAVSSYTAFLRGLPCLCRLSNIGVPKCVCCKQAVLSLVNLLFKKNQNTVKSPINAETLSQTYCTGWTCTTHRHTYTYTHFYSSHPRNNLCLKIIKFLFGHKLHNHRLCQV